MPSVLSTCHIFLNTALTEAFCIAICEAARMGLAVVSSDVGGIPEVLSPDLVSLTTPTVSGMTAKLQKTIHRVRSGEGMSRTAIAKQAATRYNWSQVCVQTLAVYR